jgi:tRNA threonylcarbamoyladenosine biosynthesis protein TsaB
MSDWKILALETSTERLSLAILAGGRAFIRDVEAGQRHSELTLPLIHELLAESGIRIADLDVVAFGQGPGSFTGVRIAAGLTQGIAFGAGKPVIPVETQMTLAEQCAAGSGNELKRVIVAIDARMEEIYFAAYEISDDAAMGWSHVIAPRLLKPAELPAIDGADWMLTGSALAVSATLRDALRTRYSGNLAGEINMAPAFPRAIDVAHLAARQLDRIGIASALNAAEAVPLYLRNHVAMTIEERAAHHARKAATV